MNVLGRIGAIAAVVAVAASGATAVADADAIRLINGSYTATQKPVGGAHGASLPAETNTWIASSWCALSGCLAAVASSSLINFTLLSDGTAWSRLSTGDTGDCHGVTVPAVTANLRLVPGGGGSYTGVRTVTVPCDGVAVDLSQPLTVTPVRS
jgi:hypothetical protein